MPDRLEPTDWMEDLLVRTVTTMEFPPTPDIATAVRARLAMGHQRSVPPRPAARTWARALGAGLAVLLVASAVAVSASSGAREAVAEFLGLGVRGERIEILPTPAPGTTATPLPAAIGLDQYATPVPAASLAARVGFEPARPEGAGALLGTYVIDYGPLKVPVLQYERFDLWQVAFDNGELGKGIPYFGKGANVISEVTVNSKPAYWIEGGGHILYVVGPDGTVVAGSQRTVDRDTLVWRSASGVNYRMETSLSLQEALTIARTLP